MYKKGNTDDCSQLQTYICLKCIFKNNGKNVKARVKLTYYVQNKCIKTTLILEYVGNSHSYNTRTSSKVANKCARSNILQSSPICRGVIQYNSVSDHIASLSTYITF